MEIKHFLIFGLTKYCAIIRNVKKVMQKDRPVARKDIDELAKRVHNDMEEFARIVNQAVQKTQDELSSQIGEVQKDVQSVDRRLGRIERQFHGHIDDYAHTKKRVTRVESRLGLKPLPLA